MRLSRLSRFRPARSPIAFWLAVAVLALLTASAVARVVGRADALAARYGPLRPILVAARPVARGAHLAEEDLAVRRLPAAFLPEGAFASAAGALGRVAVAPLVPGQVVLAGHLAPDGLSGVAALLPPGTRGLAVPAGAAAGLVRRGDLVDVLLATFDPSVAGGGEPAMAVAVGSLVVDVGTETATLALTSEEARRVAFALAHGTVSLAVTPGLDRETRQAPEAPPAPSRFSERR